jgi:GntR family transcriptional regulator, arabinose operon transcriptional repressor
MGKNQGIDFMNKTGLNNGRRASQKRDANPDQGLPKHRQVFDRLFAEIKSGFYKPQDRLPSEAELGKSFDASRITIAKAVNELQRLGLVSRRAGAGTFVLPGSSTAGHVFGLLIPDLGRTEIFEPICQGMMRSPLASSHSLLWGHAMAQEAQQEKEAEQLCRHFISQKVTGVFFAPLEYTEKKDEVNARIVQALDAAGVRVVLLDRCFEPYPSRSKYDLVGTDNRRTGFQITQHFLNMGARRIAFIARPLSAASVDARIAGYREALYLAGIAADDDLVRRGAPDDLNFIKKLLCECRPEAVVCANDLTAACFMQGLTDIGVRVPEELRIAGIDDVKYASLLPVPLTTHHQNCADIGAVAMVTMLERVATPDLPGRDVLLQTSLMIRKSCGYSLGRINQ